MRNAPSQLDSTPPVTAAPASSATQDASSPSDVVVSAAGVCVHYGSIVALAPTTLRFDAGESVALVGPNGSGKSTLLSVLAGLLPPTAGTVVRGSGRVAAFVAQHQHQHRWMPLSVGDVLRMGRYGKRGLLGRLHAADRRAIADAAERMAVGDLTRRPFGTLSGGQRQRVLVAQALATEPDLLLLDEPITGLDLASQQRIIDVIAEETAGGTTVALSTHHLGEARTTGRVLLMAGCVVADGPPSDVLKPELLAEVFGNRMVTADGGAVVIDDHGHVEEPADDVDPGDLIPQHRHDHEHDHPIE